MHELVAGVRVRGRWHGPVEIMSATHHGETAASLVIRRVDGSLGEEMVFADDLAGMSVVADDSRPWSFTADPAQFKLSAEALRIRMAGVYDPMLAVTTSDISPLPHQLRAVYGELLPRTPLRFLLADDPGAGKTVMAGFTPKN